MSAGAIMYLLNDKLPWIRGSGDKVFHKNGVHLYFL